MKRATSKTAENSQMDTRLSAVHISNVISVDTLMLDLGDKGIILVGPNGSGKSNIVRTVEEVFNPVLSANLVVRDPLNPLRNSAGVYYETHSTSITGLYS